MTRQKVNKVVNIRFYSVALNVALDKTIITVTVSNGDKIGLSIAHSVRALSQLTTTSNLM